MSDPAYQEELLFIDFSFEDRLIPVTPTDCHIVSVRVCDLPFKLSSESVKSALSVFGDVFSVCVVCFKDFPGIFNGNRVLLLTVPESIPSSVNVAGFLSRVWYPGQPVVCSICRQSGHLPRAYPLSGLCRRWKQPGHVAWECTQAWGPSRPVPAASVPVPSLPSDPVPSPSPVVPDVPSAVGLFSDPVLSSFLFVASSFPAPAPVPVSPSAADLKKFVSLFPQQS